MKKFFSLVLALVMALSLTTVAWGAATALPTADANGVITLTEDVTLTFTGNAGVALADGTVIDGAGYTLTLEGNVGSYSSSAALYNKNAGANIVIQNLKIDNNLTSGYVFDFADATLDDVDITGGRTFGLIVMRNGAAGDEVVVKDCDFADYTGDAISTESGKNTPLSIENSTFTEAEGNRNPAVIFRNNESSSVGSTYNAEFGLYADDAAANLTGNTFNAEVTLYFSDETLTGNSFGSEAAIELKNNATDVDVSGNYWGGGAPSATQIPAAIADKVTVDTYATSVAADGTMSGFAVVGDTTAAAVKFYQADNSTTGWALLHTFVGADLDDFAMGADENCLPCYLVAGDYYAESTIAAATYKLAYGTKTVYLAPVDSTDVCYSAKASVLKVVDAEDATCGNWYVADLDETAAYYATTDKKTGAVTAVYVAAKNGPVQLLVNGKIVDVKVDTAVKQLTHAWDGYDVVNGVYTSVKCANCEKVAKLYANATAAGKKAELVPGFGWITEAAAGYTAAGGSVSTGKVESAETFDAGIAMYVGMSVLAATGSAVVLKKKD